MGLAHLDSVLNLVLLLLRLQVAQPESRKNVLGFFAQSRHGIAVVCGTRLIGLIQQPLIVCVGIVPSLRPRRAFVKSTSLGAANFEDFFFQADLLQPFLSFFPVAS